VFAGKSVLGCFVFNSPPNLGGAALEVVGCLYFALVACSNSPRQNFTCYFIFGKNSADPCLRRFALQGRQAL